MKEVLVVRTGTANLASILAGLTRAGRTARVTSSADEVKSAERVVLPGVGALGSAMLQLERDRLVEALRTRISEDRPTMAVCVGLQLLLEGSQESPGVAALGILPGLAARYPDRVRVPQLGWNRVEPDPDCRWLTPGCAYFANSYRLADPPPGCQAAYADHGGRFVAALERGNLLACQFHPELSGKWGQALIERWLDRAGGAAC